MIKKYKLFKESLLNKLEGPTEEEIWNNIKNDSGESIIHHAIENNSLNLLKKGFEKLNIPRKKLTKLKIDSYLNDAVENKCSLDFVEFLLLKGANPLNKIYFDTPLEIAKFYENDELVELLKKYINNTLNESLLDKLQGPTDEELRDNLSKMDILDWHKKVKELGLDSSYLPDGEKIREKLQELTLLSWFKAVSRLGLDYSFLPDDDQIKQKLEKQPLMKSIDDIFSLDLGEEFLPTKEDIENKFINKEIDINEYYEICKLLIIDFMSKDEIRKNVLSDVIYQKYKNDSEGLFNYFTDGINLITKSIISYWYYGKYNTIYFKYESKIKTVYVNPTILQRWLLLFGEEELNEYLDYFFGEKLNTHKLRGNVYLSKLEVGSPWVY